MIGPKCLLSTFISIFIKREQETLVLRKEVLIWLGSVLRAGCQKSSVGEMRVENIMAADHFLPPHFSHQLSCHHEQLQHIRQIKKQKTTCNWNLWPWDFQWDRKHILIYKRPLTFPPFSCQIHDSDTLGWEYFFIVDPLTAKNVAKNTSQLLGICCYLKLMVANLCTRAQGASFVSVGPDLL